MNESSADINEDSDCSSHSVGIDKQLENEDTHSRSTEKHLSIEKNSSKVHPIETAPAEKGDSVKDSESVEQSHSASCEEKIEPDDTSSCSSTSKTSDVNCVGINNVDTLNDVESSVVAENSVARNGESRTSHILYNLYTISVSGVILYVCLASEFFWISYGSMCLIVELYQYQNSI